MFNTQADSEKPSTRVEQKKTVTIKEVSFGERGEPVDNSSEYEEDELTDMELTGHDHITYTATKLRVL